MTSGEKTNLIKSYVEDYFNTTGEHIRVLPCSRWEYAASLSLNVDYWKLVKVIFDFTGWKKQDTFVKSNTPEKVFRRGLIDFIAVNNGCTYSHCARITDRHHTTVIHSISQFENRLETELHIRRYFYEVVRYIRENYYIYENQIINEDSFTV